jgi:uncharacterized membrane protein YoaK (UPF0700 family)
VFVANMPGNVVFLGFALAGVGEISIVASLLAVLAFAVGATDVDRAARPSYGRPERRRTPPGRARLDHHGAHLDGHRPGRRHTTSPSVRARRLLSVAAMLAGALTGGVLLHWVALAAPLWWAEVLLAVCAAGAFLAAGRPRSQAWR